MATTRNARNGVYGGVLNGMSMGDPGSVHSVLFEQLTAVGASPAVPMPGGASSAILQTVVVGAPTAATVVVQGSNDGVNWTNLPIPGPQTTLQFPFTQVRLNCTALTGGTSPSIVACAIVNP